MDSSPIGAPGTRIARKAQAREKSRSGRYSGGDAANRETRDAGRAIDRRLLQLIVEKRIQQLPADRKLVSLIVDLCCCPRDATIK
jgi:hypothetical protein